MKFVIEEGRGNGYDESLVDAITESAGRLTAKGIQPSTLILSAADYEVLRSEAPHLPELAQINEGAVAIFDGMCIEIEE